MFAGIVEQTGTLKGVTDAGGSGVSAARRLEIAMGALLDDLRPGASVAINGCCLSLTEKRGDCGVFEAIPETLRMTNLGDLRPGDAVNLERSLKVGDRLEGHFVQGHVDACAPLIGIDREAGEYKLWVEAPNGVRPYLVRKGSITLDGVSLTLVDVADDRFSVALIPLTREHTTLGNRRPGERINIESDILARMIVSRLDLLRSAATAGEQSDVTLDSLRSAGFLE